MFDFAHKRVHEAQIADTLNEMAADGWDVDFLVVVPPNEYTIVFRRPKPPARIEAVPPAGGVTAVSSSGSGPAPAPPNPVPPNPSIDAATRDFKKAAETITKGRKK